MAAEQRLPGAVPYVLKSGEGLAHLVAGQVIRTLAGVTETSGGFGAVICDCPLDRSPIPMHWHEKEHDTWFCTRGKLQVWCGDQSRVMSPGDFAYVKPGDAHSYQSVAPRTQFFGIVAPGGWEQFFVDAGEVWGMTGLPPANHPFDFSRMGPAMGKHRIMRIDNPDYVAPVPIGPADQQLPAGPASYFLEASFGHRRALLGHLSTAVLTSAQTGGLLDMRVIEAGRNAAVPKLVHEQTHLVLYVLDGELSLTLNGVPHRLSGGDTVNIPANTDYSIRVSSGSARWINTTSGGDGGAFWDQIGEDTPAFSFPLQFDAEQNLEHLRGLEGTDVKVL